MQNVTLDSELVLSSVSDLKAGKSNGLERFVFPFKCLITF